VTPVRWLLGRKEQAKPAAGGKRVLLVLDADPRLGKRLRRKAVEETGR